MSEYQIVPDKDGKPTKCTFSEGRLTMCWPLATAMEFPYGQGSRKQGLKLHAMVNVETHKFSRQAVRVVSGEWGKSGAEITFCPFCAGILSPALAEEISVTITELNPETTETT